MLERNEKNGKSQQRSRESQEGNRRHKGEPSEILELKNIMTKENTH